MNPVSAKVLSGLALILALVALVNPVFRRTYYAAAPSSGTAEVIANGTRLMTGAEGDGRTIASLKRGDKLNILTFRPDLKNEWVAAQYVDAHHASEPGYVRLADVANWSRLSLLEAFKPAPEANLEQRALYVARLQNFLKTAPPEDADYTRLAIAHEQLGFARAAEANHQSTLRVKELAHDAQRTLSATPPAFQQKQEVQNVMMALNTLAPPPPAAVPVTEATVPPAPAPAAAGAPAPAGTSPAAPATGQLSPVPTEPAYSAEADFSRANSAFDNGEYERAKRALGRILNHEPKNEKARAFLSRVLAAQKIDPGVGR